MLATIRRSRTCSSLTDPARGSVKSSQERRECDRATVLHFDNAPVRGGAEEHLLTLLRGFDRSRFRLIVVLHPKLAQLLGSDVPADILTVPLALSSPADMSGALQFVNLLRKHRVDLVHSHMFQSSRLASPLAWMAQVPAIVETPHIREHWRQGFIKGSFWPDRLIGRFLSAYIAVSHANSEYLINEKRLPAKKVHVVCNGIAVERFDPSRKSPSELRHSLKLERDDPVVVVLGRLEPQKGHAVLLNAWHSVVRRFPGANLVCVGTGSLRAKLEKLATDLEIGTSVHFVGHQANIPDWLALADFSVLPSFYEGLPLVAIESLAAGRAVVATEIDGTSEVVLNEQTGLLVPPGKPEPLCAAISRLLENPTLTRTLGLAGRCLVEDRFTDVRQVRETEAVYTQLLRGRRGF